MEVVSGPAIIINQNNLCTLKSTGPGFVLTKDNSNIITKHRFDDMGYLHDIDGEPATRKRYMNGGIYLQHWKHGLLHGISEYRDDKDTKLNSNDFVSLRHHIIEEWENGKKIKTIKDEYTKIQPNFIIDEWKNGQKIKTIMGEYSEIK